MDKYEELEFIPRLGIDGLVRKEVGFNGRCPICKDSKKNQNKRRFWILTKKPTIMTYCFNCGYSKSLKYLIKDINPNLYNEYKTKENQEKIKNGSILKKQKNIDINIHTEIIYKFNLSSRYFKPAKNYEKAVRFCKERHILDKIDELYYCIHPKMPYSGMLIFPMLLEDNETLYGFIGRHTEFKKFYIHSKNEMFKIYNIFHVNLEENVYVFEAIIDSFVVPNSVACLGADISQNLLAMLKKPIFAFDNDSTGRKKTLKYLELGYNCVIYPDNFKYKDLNKALCSGVPKTDLINIVTNNVYPPSTGITRIKLQMLTKKE